MNFTFLTQPPFLIFVGIVANFVWFYYDEHIPYTLQTKQGKKNIAQTIFGFLFAVYMYFYIPANFVFDNKFIESLAYLFIGAGTQGLLIAFFKYRDKKITQINKKVEEDTGESFKIIEQKTTITEEQKPKTD